MSGLQQILDELVAHLRGSEEWGDVADYIPELAKVPPRQIAIAVATAEGECHAAGDADVAFSIQSVSKIFTLAIALGRAGDQLWSRVGREPSGRAFNSIIQLEQEQGRPRNPFINAGAIVTTRTSWSEMARPSASTAGTTAGSAAWRPRVKNQSIRPSGGGGVPSGRVRWVATPSALQARQSYPRAAATSNSGS